MQVLRLGLFLAIAVLMLSPRTAAAQCGGESTTAGYYAYNGSYVPGGCGTTNLNVAGPFYRPSADLTGNPLSIPGLLPGQAPPVGARSVPAWNAGSGLGPALSPSMLGGPNALTGGTAYGYNLPVGPAVSSQAVSPTAPPSSSSLLPPGRGSPSYSGEERGDGTIGPGPNP